MGHFFNLLHTHESRYGYELVNGSNCENAGDLCCDTPADPGLSSTNMDYNCHYIGWATDANGDSYEPDPRNIMSYAVKDCRDSFTPDQYMRIREAAFLSNRQTLCNHCTILQNGSITSNTSISNDVVIVNNSYINDNHILISACHMVRFNNSVTLEKGVIIQPQN